MRTTLIRCRMSKCFTEIAFRNGTTPICFYGHSGTGNSCSEPDDNFVSLPFEPILYRVYGKLKRLKLIK